MGPFFKGWIPADFHVPDRGTSRQKKNAFCPVTIPKWFCRTLQTHAFNPTVASAGKKGASQAVKKGLQGSAGRAGFRTCGNGPVFQRLDSGGFPQNSNRSFDPTRRQ
jgi:hypothetical protein